MNGGNPISTAHGIAGLVVLALFLILLAHFVGVRVIFAAGRPA